MRTTLLVVCCIGVAFQLRVLVALLQEWMTVQRISKLSVTPFRRSRPRGEIVVMQGAAAREKICIERSGKAASGQFRKRLALFIVMPICAVVLHAQQPESTEKGVPRTSDMENLQVRVETLEGEVSTLRSLVRQLQASQSQPHPALVSAVSTGPTDPPPPESALTPDDRKIIDSLRQTTINVGVDTYYGYNFNNPVGRVNLLRAYDVLSNEFSLNQASVVVEHAPDVGAGRRLGARLDLQFGQATDAIQGNPSNEPRPQVYRNIFQAYGTYVAPIGKGLTVDFGKWASSLGIEGNYTKDQMSYSRSLWFYFLPFYHMGARASLPLNDRFSVNYWVVNGTNQVEDVNGFKDQLFGFTAKPSRTLTWTFNYYLGQENPDRAPAANCGPAPVDPGLCFNAISPAPTGRTHIFDSYATWQATPKLTMAIEGDYFIQRLWRNAAPGESSAPAHVDGGAAYMQYQFTPRIALASRAEYMSDRQGIFSGIGQALKENTITFDYKLADNFLMRYEWRRDFSNQPSFLSEVQGFLKKDQNTATLGLVWWWGRKQGSW